TGSGAAGHEELYVVVRGRATFTLDGERVDAPAGTLVFVRDPTVRRVAIAEEEDPPVLAGGGGPGRADGASARGVCFSAMRALRAGRWEEAIETIAAGLDDHPGNPSILYNLACAESRAGRTADALAHLREAIDGDERCRERARKDPDLDPIRGEPGF